MPPAPTRVNRGPAAAAENRQALLASARRVFAERGYAVPLSAIAKDAGLGQAVLYRHFPTKLSLAFAVFEENFVELEAVAADPADDAFRRLWDRLVSLVVDESAFLEMVVEARRALPEYDGGERLRALVDATLPRARAAGLVDAALTSADVLLAVRMAHGVVVTATAGEDVRSLAHGLLGGLPHA